nr:IST1-like protein [Tanacetum cinerariifolium]
MGRKLDALLGQNSKTSKLKTTLKLAISRLPLLKQATDCPEELKEAASSLLYAAPRCGEFPELQEIRAILTKCFGKEFVNGAIELRSNCRVSQKMIQKWSPKWSSLECRIEILAGIAKENGVVLQLETSSPEIIEEQLVVEKKPSQLNTKATVLKKKIEKVLSLSESMKERRNYKDAADAAQDAFEAAAYAAAAARAAVELARLESFDSDGPDSPDYRPRKVPSPRYDSESDYEEITEENEGERSKYSKQVKECEDVDSDGYSDDDNIKSFEKMIFYESDYKTEDEETGFQSRTAHFSSYKQFPFRHQANPKAGPGSGNMKSQLDLENKINAMRTKRVYGR